MILFVNTIFIDRNIITQMKKKFNKIFTNAKTSRIVFNDLIIKSLLIFDFIYLYNYFMNNVDVANQLRNYYISQRMHLKI